MGNEDKYDCSYKILDLIKKVARLVIKQIGILWLNARQDDSMYEVTTSPSIRHKIHLILCRKLQMADSPITIELQQNYNR